MALAGCSVGAVVDFDVADSFGIAHYANKVLTER